MPHDDEDEDDRPRRRRRRREDDYDEDDRPRRRSDEIDPVGFIVPTDVSAWSIVSCYAGLIGFCIPLLGLPFALVAFVCGIVAWRKRSKAASYGAVTSDARAIIGLVLSTLSLIINAVLIALMAAKGAWG